MSYLARRVLARFLKAAKKRLVVFDFDDTLVSSKGVVSVVKSNGEKIEMDSATFAHYKPSAGDKLDFGAFNNVTNPRKIKKNFDHLQEAVAAGDKVVILTARAKGSESSVTKFMASQGVKGVDVVGLASSDPYDKARWIDKAIEDGGYDDVEFFDDSVANANAVREHGEKHKGIKFASTNVPHPKEGDYDGPVITQDFKSDSPTAAVVEYKAKPKADGDKSEAEPKEKKPEHSDWWEEQTEHFKKNYCTEHDESRYCR